MIASIRLVFATLIQRALEWDELASCRDHIEVLNVRNQLLTEQLLTLEQRIESDRNAIGDRYMRASNTDRFAEEYQSLINYVSALAAKEQRAGELHLDRDGNPSEVGWLLGRAAAFREVLKRLQPSERKVG